MYKRKALLFLFNTKFNNHISLSVLHCQSFSLYDAEFCRCKSNCSFQTIALRYILCLYHKVSRCTISNLGTFTLNGLIFLSDTPGIGVLFCACITVHPLTNCKTMCLHKLTFKLMEVCECLSAI